MKKLVVATHDGKFHADEVFACAILKRIYPGMKIIRTRDLKELNKADMRIDVGGKYNPKTNDFDHHQASFNLKRKSGILYSSCGLIWKNFGRKVVNSNEGWEYIDRNLIEFIDADDNGITYSNGVVNLYSLHEVIKSFDPAWDLLDKENERFFEALSFAEKILDNEISKANWIKKGEEIVRDCIKKSSGSFVVLPYPGLPKSDLIKNKDIKFFVFPAKKDEWISVSVPVEEKSFVRRKYFPKSWAGLTGEKLEKVCGIKGAKFCHKEIFISAAKTKEAIIEMTKIALMEGEDER